MCCKDSALLFKINNKIWMTLPVVHRSTCRHLMHIKFFLKKSPSELVSYIVWYLSCDNIFIFLCQRLLAVTLYTQYNGFNKNISTKAWHKSLFLALGRLRQEDFQFEANLDPHRFCLQNQTENHNRDWKHHPLLRVWRNRSSLALMMGMCRPLFQLGGSSNV